MTLYFFHFLIDGPCLIFVGLCLPHVFGEIPWMDSKETSVSTRGPSNVLEVLKGWPPVTECSLYIKGHVLKGSHFV